MEKGVFMDEKLIDLEGAVNGYFNWVGKRRGAKDFLIIHIFLERKKIKDLQQSLYYIF